MHVVTAIIPPHVCIVMQLELFIVNFKKVLTMKHLLKSLKVLSLVLGAVVSVVAAEPEVSLVGAGQKSFALYLDDVRSKSVSVQILDARGVVLLEDRVKTQRTLGRKYNLSNLPAGEYNVFVEDGALTIVQPITLGHTTVQIHEERTTRFFQPALRSRDDKLDFTLLCVDPSAVAISIFDPAGNLAYSSATSESGSMQRRFDLSALESGNYIVLTHVRRGNLEKSWRNVIAVKA